MTITLTAKQARIVARALDTYLRLGLGQIWTVAERLEELHPAKKFCHWEIRKKWTDAMTADLLGFTPGGSYGISNPLVHDDAKIAYDIEQAMRGTHILHMGSEPIPTVRL
jgi:hypothetical protein